MEIRYRKLQNRTGHEAGRQLLREMYQEMTGQMMPEICIASRGKPYFSDGKLHFSITHTKHYVFCALSEKNIGIDAEETERNIDLRLADKILSPEEKARFLQAEDPRQALLKLWVLKEAAGKLSGEGINGYPVHTDFSPDDPRVQEIEGCFVAILEE